LPLPKRNSCQDSQHHSRSQQAANHSSAPTSLPPRAVLYESCFVGIKEEWLLSHAPVQQSEALIVPQVRVALTVIIPGMDSVPERRQRSKPDTGVELFEPLAHFRPSSHQLIVGWLGVCARRAVVTLVAPQRDQSRVVKSLKDLSDALILRFVAMC
jgi:hypothetical protein